MKTLTLILLASVFFYSGCENRSEHTSHEKQLSNSPETSGDNSQPAITDKSGELPLDKVRLPPGFTIEIFAEVDNARSLAVSPSGIVFAGNRNGDKVYAVQDSD